VKPILGAALARIGAEFNSRATLFLILRRPRSGPRRTQRLRKCVLRGPPLRDGRLRIRNFGAGRSYLGVYGAGLGLAALMFASAASAQPCMGLCGAQALAPVFRALDAAKAGKRDRPVHIIQIGDSHTANDFIAGALRDQLQSKYGRGGRGVLPPGTPYKGFAMRLVQLSQSGDWRTQLSFAPPPSPAHPDWPRLYTAPGPFGISGYRLTSTGAASLTLDAESNAGFNRAVVCALAAPGAGAVTLSAGAAHERFPLDAKATQAVCHSLHIDAPQHQLRLTTDGGPVSLLSWATFADGGVALSNLGVSGTQLRDFAARDDATMSTEFEAYRPDLIILAYGTNEGYGSSVDPTAYEALLKDQLRRLKRLTHGAPVLVLGAPDADTLRPDLYGSGGTFPNCAPLSGEEQRNFAALIAQRSPRLARWYPPMGLEQIRGAQKRAAAAEGAVFWDWGARMGGPCAAHRMSQADPKLVRGDHVHFTVEGGAKIAGLLFSDLMAADHDAAGAR
jgi:lysophospholipase L1-like esterase